MSSYADRRLIGRVFALTKPYRPLFWLAAVLSVLLAPISILRPYLVQVTVDYYILPKDSLGLVQMLVWLFAVLLLEGAFSYVFSYTTSWLGQSIIRDLRTKLFAHVIRLRLSYFDRTPVGTITTRTINDMESVNTVFSEGLITITADILTLIFVLAVMFYSSWKLTLVCLVTFPPLVYSGIWFKNSVKRSYEKVRNQVSAMNAFMQERISGMRIVQIFNAEDKEYDKFKQINERYTKANLDAIFAYAVFFPVVEILSAASLGLMVWYGASGVLEGTTTLGTLVAFPLYLGMLFRPIRMLADKFNSIQMGLVASNRVFELLDNQEQLSNSGSVKVDKLRGDIRFKNVWFSYEQDNPEPEQWILQDLSFDLPAGQSLAIVGSTGAGKSTLINLLSRFYELHRGQIEIDGLDLREYELQSLRRRIAVVLQDVFLFSGTVLENISLKDERISLEQVRQAAQLIGAEDFILQLLGGYDYQVMERGLGLSMGQRQLISFIRALVFDPDILILDEATSAIDPETESVIQKAIEKLTTNRSSIIIAHRLSTIQDADSIMVLDKGRCVEKGRHQELMQKPDGPYRSLVETAYAKLS